LDETGNTRLIFRNETGLHRCIHHLEAHRAIMPLSAVKGRILQIEQAGELRTACLTNPDGASLSRDARDGLRFEAQPDETGVIDNPIPQPAAQFAELACSDQEESGAEKMERPSKGVCHWS
jgi:glycine/D-amino acid oxidase-like deaminating enzyme